ncbi:hypothetical protein ACFVU2_19715 [Leifsonia sp. NPDC058194]|uniref:hypothetical protein n=1 Tax=Leifsonia sp. NPDC058194 TaxID=3346374 RepID=UPI0036D8685A
MNIDTPEPPAPARAYAPAFNAVMIDDAQVVLDESFDTASARRDALIETILANHDEITTDEVEEILAPLGGANADAALGEVLALLNEAGVPVDVHLAEHQRDVGPAVLYTTFTDYGDGSTYVEHYGSRDDRLLQLRQRALNVAIGYPSEFFQNADEETCKKVIEGALAPGGGRIFLLDAERHAAGEAYESFAH